MFPGSPHAYCYKHLKGNLEHRFLGKMKNTRESIIKLFQKCAYVTTKRGFEKCVQQLKLVGGHQVNEFLKDAPKETWANAYFVGKRYGYMTSNASESWNNQIRYERLLPVVSLIEGIMCLLMEQMCNRREQAARWPTKLCKSIETQMTARVDKARGWEVKKSTDDI